MFRSLKNISCIKKLYNLKPAFARLGIVKSDKDSRANKVALFINSDLEETFTRPFKKQKTTVDKLVAKDIKKDKGEIAENEWAQQFKIKRAAYSKSVLGGTATEYDFLDYWGVFAGVLKTEHFKILSDSLSVNPNYIKTIKRLKRLTGADEVKIKIVARGFGQPFEMFFQRSDIINELAKIGIDANLIEIKANYLVMKNGVFTGELRPPIIVNKTDFTDENTIFLGDERDIPYNMPYFINVNSRSLIKDIRSVTEKWIKQTLWAQ